MRILRGAATLVLLAGGAALASACFSSSGGSGGPQASFDAGYEGADFDAGSDSTSQPDVEQDSTVDSTVDSATPETGTDSAVADTSTPTDSGTGPDALDASQEAGLDALADVAPDTAVGGTAFFVDPVNGLDTNPGTMAAPFQSMAHATFAMNLTGAGGAPFTLVLADGTYSASNQSSLTISFQYSTFVRGSAPGAVTILGQGPAGAQEGFVFTHGGGALDIDFKDTWYGVNAQGGNFSVTGCSFDGAGGGGYFAAFTGNTTGFLDTTGATIANVQGGTSGGGLLLDNTATVAWLGGGVTVTGGLGGNLVFMRGGAHITIDSVNVSAYPGYVLVGYDQISATVQNSTIAGSGSYPGVGGLTTAGVFYIGGSQTGVPAPSLDLINTSVTGTQGNAIAVELTPTTGVVTVSTQSSHLDTSSLAGIWVNGSLASAALAVDITAKSTTLDGNGLPGIYAPRANLFFSGAGNSVSSNGAMAGTFSQTPGGIVLLDATGPSTVSARNVTLSGNTANQIAMAGSAASVLDLGAAADPGLNTFAGVGVNYAAVNLVAPIAASAIGNTWMAGVQGADATGKYTTTTTITGPASGQNVIAAAGSSVVMAP